MRLTISRLTDGKISGHAREVQLDLWRNRGAIWNVVPTDLSEIFDPGVALARLGFVVETAPSLGIATIEGQRSEVTAALYRNEGLVVIKEGQPLGALRFALAHELGHVVLHPDIELAHRDVPTHGDRIVRDPMEVEANKFATCFLMPEKTVRTQFMECFGCERIEPTPDAAYAVFGVDFDRAWKKFRSPRQISSYIATATMFNGRPLRPLYSQFSVSPQAMSNRLEELQLVRGWRVA